MKNKKPKRITLLGNNSGRNLGDAAIMSSILDMIAKELPDSEVLVPSLNPGFVNDNYAEDYNVKAVDVRLRTLSLRLLGLPTFYSLLRSDVALICDGIIFGRKLFSPHNFLITLIFLVPFAKLVGCKVVCFSCGIGPFPSKLSKIFAKLVIQLSDLVIMRERDSAKLARDIGVTKQIRINGDSAFVNPIAGVEDAIEILEENNVRLDKPFLGLNITPYIDSWLKAEERIDNKKAFLENYARNVKFALKKITTEEPEILVFSCSPMDEEYSHKFAKLLNATVIDNTRYLSHSIQAVMRECDLLVGMRFHSLVLSSAAGSAILGLVYAPKVKGYMRLIDSEKYCIELKDVDKPIFIDTLADAWDNRAELRAKQQEVVSHLKDTALDAMRVTLDQL